MRVLFFLFSICLNSFSLIAQLDTTTNFCLEMSKIAVLDSSVKYLTRIEIYNKDTIIKYKSYFENGRPVYTDFDNFRNEFKFDSKNEKLIEMREVEYINTEYKKKKIKKESCHICKYNESNHLVKYIYHEKLKNKVIETYVDSIIYFNDSIFFIGGEYMMSIKSKKINENQSQRIVRNQEGEIIKIENFIDNKIIDSQFFKKNKLTTSIIYIYDRNNFLDLKIISTHKDDEIKLDEIVRYIYNDNSKKVKQLNYDSNRAMYFFIEYQYNEKGLIEIERETYLNSGKQRIYKYEYEYWGSGW